MSISLEHNPALVAIGARMAGVKESEVEKTRETEAGGLVVITADRKFTYDADTYAAAKKNPRKTGFESIQQQEAAIIAPVKPKRAKKS